MLRKKTYAIGSEKTRLLLSIGAFCVVFFSLLCLPIFKPAISRAATAPAIITYQGKLLVNNLSATTTQSMYFVLYDSLTSGNVLYTAGGTLAATTSISVTPSNGIFTVNLGGSGTNTLDPSIFQNNAAVYLEVRVGSEILTPRKQITASPYAFNARYLDGVAATSTASSSTYIPISDSNGNFTFNSVTTTNVTSTQFYDSGLSTFAGGFIANASSSIGAGFQVAGALNASSSFQVAGASVFGGALTVNSGNIANFIGGFISNASSSIGANLTVSGPLSASSTLTVNGASTLTGLATFTNGFISNASSSIGGQLTVNGALNASSSLLVNNSIYLAQQSGYNLGKFYVDSSGNVSVSGTLNVVGATTNTGLATFTNGFISNASSSVGAGLQVAGALNASSSLFVNNSIYLAQQSGYNLGKFYVDSSGNISASGTLSFFNGATDLTTLLDGTNLILGKTGGFNHGTLYIDSSGNISTSGTLSVVGATTNTGLTTLAGGFISNASSSIGGQLTVNGALNASSSLLVNNSIYLAQQSGYNLGKFYVDSSGNVSASGTLTVAGATTNTGLTTFTNGFISNASSSVGAGLQVAGALNASGTFQVANASVFGGALTVNSGNLANLIGGFISNASSSIGAGLQVAGALNASSSFQVAGNSVLGDSDAAGGDTTRIYGALGLGVTPTGNAQLLVQATSTVAVPLSVNDDAGLQMLKFSSSTITALQNATAEVTANGIANLTLGSNTLGGAIVLKSNVSGQGNGLIIQRNSFGAIGTFLGGGDLIISNDGTNTSTLQENSLILGQSSGNNLGQFYVDNSGNISASGSLQFNNSLTLAKGAGANLGNFYVDSGGNVSASGSLQIIQNFTIGKGVGFNQGQFYVDQNGNVSASGTVESTGLIESTQGLIVNKASGFNLGRFYVDNNGTISTSGSLQIGNNGSATIILNYGSGQHLGNFYVDGSGNVSTSGTLTVAGATTNTGLTTFTNGFISNASSSVGAGLQVAGALNASSSFQVAGNSVLGDSDAAGGDTTRIYGALGLGVTPTGNAQLLVQATSTVAVPLSINDSNGSQMLKFSSSTFTGLQDAVTPATLNDMANLTLGGSALTGVIDLKVSSVGAAMGISGGVVVERNTSGDIGAFLNGGALYLTGDGNVTSTLRSNSFILGQSSGQNLGIFYVDNNGNMSASGTAEFSQGLIVNKASGFNLGKFYVDNGGSVNTSGSLQIGNNGSGTIMLNYGPVQHLGNFYVDGSGNVSTSGTLSVKNQGGGFTVSATSATTTFTSNATGNNGSTAFLFDTLNSFSSTTNGTPLDRTLFTVANAGVNKFEISGGGNVYAKAGFNANSSEYGIGDVAEYVNLDPGAIAEPGDILVVSSSSDKYHRSESSYATNVVGVISDTGAFVIGASGVDRVPLGLAGVVHVNASAENGPISVGDYLATASTQGYAMRYDPASGKAGSIIGMALETLSSGQGKINVILQKNLATESVAGLTSALSVNSVNNTLQVGSNQTAYNIALSGNLSMTGTSLDTLSFATTSLFSSAASAVPGAHAFIFDATNFAASSSNEYVLSVRSNSNAVFSVMANGDVRAKGDLYAASAIFGTSTNPGDLAERVDIAPDDTVEAGDVMMVDPNSPDRYRRSDQAYNQSIAGVISTNPSIVVGNGKTGYTAVLAMTGRVPVKVTTENGAIKRGDLLVAASSTGFAMKYDPAKDTSAKMVAVIGMALDDFSTASSTGKIMALIRTGWIYNRDQTIFALKQDVQTIAGATGVDLSSSGGTTANLTVQTTQSGSLLPPSSGSDVDLGGSSLVNVASIAGKNQLWEIDSKGYFISHLATSVGEKNMYGLESPDAEFVFSSSSQLDAGSGRVDFDEATQEIIDKTQPIKVTVTLTSGEAKGIYVSQKDATGFTVKELSGGISNATFDWIVVAKRANPALSTDTATTTSTGTSATPVIDTTATNTIASTSTTTGSTPTTSTTTISSTTTTASSTPVTDSAPSTTSSTTSSTTTMSTTTMSTAPATDTTTATTTTTSATTSTNTTTTSTTTSATPTTTATDSTVTTSPTATSTTTTP